MMYWSLPRKRQPVRSVLTAVRRPGVRRGLLVFPALLALLGAPLDAFGQYENIILPVDSVEQLLRYGEFEVATFRDTRFEGDRTQRVILKFAANLFIAVKWAAAPRGGDSFNNRPRFEIAAYEIQKLFLNEEDYVVPPTVARAFPIDEYIRPQGVRSTLGGTDAVVVLLQYWLNAVTDDGVYDKDRIKDDSLYARHLADMNILTYLIRHADANRGNFLISTVATNPRVFAVDNGVSFGDISDRPDHWREMRTDRLPQGTVDRLRAITEEDLHQALGVLVQFEVRDKQLIQVEPTENLNPGRGVHKQDDVIQMGLTRREIGAVHRRLQDLLKDIDNGKYEIF
jgi:hypothetical protein